MPILIVFVAIDEKIVATEVTKHFEKDMKGMYAEWTNCNVMTKFRDNSPTLVKWQEFPVIFSEFQQFPEHFFVFPWLFPDTCQPCRLTEVNLTITKALNDIETYLRQNGLGQNVQQLQTVFHIVANQIPIFLQGHLAKFEFVFPWKTNMHIGFFEE